MYTVLNVQKLLVLVNAASLLQNYPQLTEVHEVATENIFSGDI